MSIGCPPELAPRFPDVREGAVGAGEPEVAGSVAGRQDVEAAVAVDVARLDVMREAAVGADDVERPVLSHSGIGPTRTGRTGSRVLDPHDVSSVDTVPNHQVRIAITVDVARRHPGGELLGCHRDLCLAYFAPDSYQESAVPPRIPSAIPSPSMSATAFASPELAGSMTLEVNNGSGSSAMEGATRMSRTTIVPRKSPVMFGRPLSLQCRCRCRCRCRCAPRCAMTDRPVFRVPVVSDRPAVPPNCVRR